MGLDSSVFRSEVSFGHFGTGADTWDTVQRKCVSAERVCVGRTHRGRTGNETLAMKPEATAIFAPQDGRWKITVSFDGRRFCVPKFRH